MERTGEVTAVHGEYIEITFCRPSDCEKCNACHGGKSQSTLLLKGQAQVGDGAVVRMPVKSFMQASATAYVFPLAALLGGVFLLFLALEGELAAGHGIVKQQTERIDICFF